MRPGGARALADVRAALQEVGCEAVPQGMTGRALLDTSRPLWDILVITLLTGGTALSITSLVPGWRAVGKNLGAIGAQEDRATG